MMVFFQLFSHRSVLSGWKCSSPLMFVSDYIKFTPGRDRQRCYFLEMVLSLPAMTTTRFSIEFERALLKWTEYPPDANHGFYVNSAVISTNLPEPDKDYITIPQSASTLAEMLVKRRMSMIQL